MLPLSHYIHVNASSLTFLLHLFCYDKKEKKAAEAIYILGKKIDAASCKLYYPIGIDKRANRGGKSFLPTGKKKS